MTLKAKAEANNSTNKPGHRKEGVTAGATAGTANALTVPAEAPVAKEERDITALVEHANALINLKDPTKQDIVAVREVMALIPGVQRTVGNIALQARQRLISDMSANIIIEESIQKEVERLEDDLGYRSAPALEKLLIRQISVCWLLLYQIQQHHTGAMAKSIPLTQANWHEKRLTLAQARFLRAVEALAKVRKLSRAVPVQINVAQQQVNVAKSDG